MTIDGEEYWTDQTAKVAEEEVPVVAATLIDVAGLQDDGTGLVGDELRVTYTADLGNPKQVTWYRDGTAIKTQTAEAAAGLTFVYGGLLGGTENPGKYYATITTGSGLNFTSNAIELSDEEAPVVMSDVTITDYTDEFAVAAAAPAYQTFDADDTKAVVTVTFNRYYEDMVLYAFADKATTYATGDAVQTWTLDEKSDNGRANGTNSPNGTTFVYTEVSSLARLTDKAAIQDGDGIYYLDKNTGEITYKLVAFTNGLKRGSSYKLVVDQAGIAEDDPTATNKDVNVSESAEAPYLPAPVAIMPTDVKGSGANGTKISATATLYLDKDMETPVPYLGSSNAAFENLATNAKLTVDIKVVEGAEAKDGTSMANTQVDAKNGKTDEFTFTATGAETGVYATVKGGKGIYGKDDINLTSAFVSLPAASASKIETSYTSPSDIKVSFTGLKTAGTVYVVRAAGNAAPTTETNLDNAIKAFDATDSDTYVGSTSVAKNVASVVVSGVVDKIYNDDATKTDLYGAIFVPDNDEDFGVVTTTVDTPTTNTKTAADTYCTVSPTATSYKVSGTLKGLKANAQTDVGAVLDTYDQFGNEMDTAAIADHGMSGFTGANGASTNNSATFKIQVVGTTGATNGAIKLTAAAASAKGDVYTYKIADGYFLTFTCTKEGAAGDAEFTCSITN